MWRERRDGDYYLSFDVPPAGQGPRVAGFVEFESEQQFEPEARRLCEVALSHVKALRSQITPLEACARYLRHETDNAEHPGWMTFHTAVAEGLTGNTERAVAYFEQHVETLRRREPRPEWSIEAERSSAELMELLKRDPEAFRERIAADIVAYRKALKLEPGDFEIDV